MVVQEPVRERLAFQRGYNQAMKESLDAMRKLKARYEEQIEPYHGKVTESDYKAAKVDDE